MAVRNVATTLGNVRGIILLINLLGKNLFLVCAPSCCRENSADELSKKGNHPTAYDKFYCHFICHIGTILERKDHSDESIMIITVTMTKLAVKTKYSVSTNLQLVL